MHPTDRTDRTPTLGAVRDLLQRRYPPGLAESWDRVGLVCGDPAQPVRRVLFAVDPHPLVAAEAREWGADLVVTHHPLLLRGVHSVAADTAKGAVVHALITAGCGLLAMHTNADSAPGGVNDALADIAGVAGTTPLVPSPADAVDKLTVHVPATHRAAVADAVFAAGAGRIGEYDSCGYWTAGTGQFRPDADARPYLGTVGTLETVAEDRLEVVLPRRLRYPVVAAMLAAHPYERPAFDVLETANPRPGSGIGRIGGVAAEQTTVGDLAARMAAGLPATAGGVRIAGDPRTMVRTVALCSGAGDSLLDAVRRTDADVYITSDLRHHPVDEHLAAGGCPVIDLPHWASEWPWLPVAAGALESDAAALDLSVHTRVSTVVTDPWTHLVRRAT